MEASQGERPEPPGSQLRAPCTPGPASARGCSGQSPLRLWDVPLQSHGLPAVSRELSRLGLTWAFPHLSAGHVACPTPGSRSGCLWDTPCCTPPPRGILRWWSYLPRSAMGLLAGRAPPTFAPAPGIRGTWVVRLLWCSLRGQGDGSNTFPSGGF